jgi:hypothetical protein
MASKAEGHGISSKHTTTGTGTGASVAFNSDEVFFT